MFIARFAIQLLFFVTKLMPYAEQEPDLVMKGAIPTSVSVESVLDEVYTQYSDKKFVSIGIWYVQDASTFPPIKFHYALDGEDRLREQYEDNGTKYILMFVNGQTTIYMPEKNEASIIPGKEPLQDSCAYLGSLGIPITDEQRATPRTFFPETLKDKSLGWSLDNNYWLIDGNECFKLTNHREEFFVDPKVGYSFRRKGVNSGARLRFSDFKTIEGKWMPFHVEYSLNEVSWTITVESLEFDSRKSFQKGFPPGTMIGNTIDKEYYYLDANGKRQDLAGTINEAKRMLPGGTSNRWLIVTGIVVLVVVAICVVLMRKKSF